MPGQSGKRQSKKEVLMSRSFNFNAGPAALPLEVLEIAQKELTDFNGTGMSIMEHSHRGKAYDAVHEEAIANISKGHLQVTLCIQRGRYHNSKWFAQGISWNIHFASSQFKFCN